jgi:intracellular sulfur oxidation DsrE/DsrF family protein
MANDAAAPAQAAEPHRLVLQISDDEPAKMRAVLDVAANVARHYSGQGEDVEIVVVAFNGGLDMLVEHRSPVKERFDEPLEIDAEYRRFVARGNTPETLAAQGRQAATADAGRRPGPGRSAALIELAEELDDRPSVRR